VFILGTIVVAGSLYYYTTSYASFNFSLNEHNDLMKNVSIVQKGIFVLTLVIIIALGLLWFYLHRFILLPLNHICKTAEHIIHGKINQTVKIKAPSELKQLSETINDLSVNVQEILLFAWNQTENSLRCIEEENYENLGVDVSNSGLNVIKNNLLELQRMISSFALYDVHMDQRRVFGNSDSD
jgi:methyl-accepting chemotaxis protein